MESVHYCPYGRFATVGDCEGPGCGKCGWNPVVHRRRLEELHRYCREGRIHEWGRSERADKE